MSGIIGQDSFEEGLGKLLVVGPELPVRPEFLKVGVHRLVGLFAPKSQSFTDIPDRKYSVCFHLSFT